MVILWVSILFQRKIEKKRKTYFIEVNSTLLGLMGIESTFANSVIPSKLYKQTLKNRTGVN